MTNSSGLENVRSKPLEELQLSGTLQDCLAVAQFICNGKDDYLGVYIVFACFLYLSHLFC